jgi:hypothetical protein
MNYILCQNNFHCEVDSLRAHSKEKSLTIRLYVFFFSSLRAHSKEKSLDR